MYWSMENVPWTNMHDLNLDWIINTMKQTVEQWIAYRIEMNQNYADFTENIENWKTEVEENFDELQTYVQDYFDNLDLNESTRYVINQMIASGEFIEVLNPSIVASVSNWLNDHVEPTSPVVDNTLTISGAAADSAVTGDYVHNGFIGKAALMTALASNTNLNNITTPGTYKCTSREICATITNKPNIDAEFTLVVFSNAVTNYITQVLFTANDGVMYTRAYREETWRTWYKTANDADLTDLRNTMLKSWIGLAADQTPIAANTDLNTIHTPGTYKCTTRAICGSLVNKPHIDTEFAMVVICAGVTNYQVQIILPANTGRLFTRSYREEAWREWNYIKFVADGDPASDVLTNIYNDNNIIDYNNIVANRRLRVSDFNNMNATNQSITYYIPVTPYMVLTLTNSLESQTYGHVFYDRDKNPIAAVKSDVDTLVVDVPANAFYVRLTLQNSQIADQSIKAYLSKKTVAIPALKWLAVGDSITYGIRSYLGSSGVVGEQYTPYCWTEMVSHYKGYDLTTMASRGMGYTASVTGQDPDDPDGPRINIDTLLSRITNMTDTFNIVTVQFGINDYYTASTTLDTIETGVVKVITALATKFPMARIIFFTPFNTWRYGDANTTYGYNGEHGSKTLKQIETRIDSICDTYGVECVKSSNKFIFNTINMPSLELDKTHPTNEAHKLIAEKMLTIL